MPPAGVERRKGYSTSACLSGAASNRDTPAI